MKTRTRQPQKHVDDYAAQPSHGKSRNSKGGASAHRHHNKVVQEIEETASDESSAFSDSSSDLGDGFSSSSEEFDDTSSSEDDFDDMPSHDDTEPPSLDRQVRRIQGVRFRDYYDISGKVSFERLYSLLYLEALLQEANFQPLSFSLLHSS